MTNIHLNILFYRADDFLVIHARDDLGNIQGTTPYTHSTPGTPINMPWLGSTQTGRGAAMVSHLLSNNNDLKHLYFNGFYFIYNMYF